MPNAFCYIKSLTVCAVGKPGCINLGQNTKHPNSTTLKKPKQIENEHWKICKLIQKRESVESESFLIHILRTLGSKVEFLSIKSTPAYRHMKNNVKVQ